MPWSRRERRPLAIVGLMSSADTARLDGCRSWRPFAPRVPVIVRLNSQGASADALYIGQMIIDSRRGAHSGWILILNMGAMAFVHPRHGPADLGGLSLHLQCSWHRR